MSDLQSRLAEAGQRLPFEVFHPEKATLGGSVASDSHGHMRSSTGGIRDWVIGMKVVLADGTVTKSGGRVVKNVQGFDLHRLHTGAYGTLGVIAELALKLAPLPSRTRTVAAWFDSVESVREMAKQVFNGPAIPEAITAFIGNNARNALAQISTTDEAEVLLLARSAGGTALVDRQVSDLTGLAGTLDARGYEVIDGTEADALWAAASTELQDGLSLVARCTLRPGSAFSFIAETMKETEQFSGEVHCGFGTALSGYPADDATRALVDSVRRAAEKFGGSAVFERCPHHLKQEIDVFGDPGASIEVMRSVKGRFDPKRVLNPGRFAGGI
jgi:glycolate oxidase FAD binding subunit